MSRNLLSLLFFLCMSPLAAQISGYNLLEYQFGGLPGDTGGEFSALYNRALADYNFRNFRAGVTMEQFYTPFGERNYTSLAQLRLQYSSDRLEVRLGNFYETLGRGILLRSYEIHGAILEDISFRSRHYFHRDISGVSVRYHANGFSTRVLYGKPLNNAFPPVSDQAVRRPDNLAAIQSDLSFHRQVAGASVLMLENERGRTWYGMARLSGNISQIFSYYTEIARQTGGPADLSGITPFALYAGINLTFERTGISLEYKNYSNFQLGAGFNEPPALVREHSYRLLNRSTHVSQPFDEKGYQAELFYYLPGAAVITLNHTLAVNNPGRRFVFREYFIGYAGSTAARHEIKVFGGLAEDPLKQERNRITAGIYAGWRLTPTWIVSSGFEFQRFDRDDHQVTNTLISLESSFRSRLSTGVVWELSSDPFLTSGSHRMWTGVNVGYRVSSRNNLRLFAGRRRGGPACYSGVCYEILDFKGVEMRLTTRF